jgi:signal transduction histidine kinase
VTEQCERASLRDADRRADEFFANLRTSSNPLAPLRNSLHLLRMKAQLESRAMRDARRSTTQAPGQSSRRLVDDRQDVAHQSRHVELRRERSTRPSCAAPSKRRTLIAAAGHRLTVSLPDTPAIVDGDPVRLAQVVANSQQRQSTRKATEGSGWRRRDGNAVVSRATAQA